MAARLGESGGVHLWEIDLSGHARQLLDIALPSTESSFSWFPDGQRLVACARYADRVPQVWLADVRASTRIQIGSQWGCPSVSPDGLYIAHWQKQATKYASTGTRSVVVRSADGRSIVARTPGTVLCLSQLTWDPQGEQVAFKGDLLTDSGLRKDLFVLRVAKGGHTVRLEPNVDLGFRDPLTWCSDGESLLLQRLVTVAGIHAQKAELVRVEVSGGGQSLFHSLPEWWSVLPGDWKCGGPTFVGTLRSPHGVGVVRDGRLLTSLGLPEDGGSGPWSAVSSMAEQTWADDGATGVALHFEAVPPVMWVYTRDTQGISMAMIRWTKDSSE